MLRRKNLLSDSFLEVELKMETKNEYVFSVMTIELSN